MGIDGAENVLPKHFHIHKNTGNKWLTNPPFPSIAVISTLFFHLLLLSIFFSSPLFYTYSYLARELETESSGNFCQKGNLTRLSSNHMF